MQLQQLLHEPYVTHTHFNLDVYNITESGLDEIGSQAKFPQRKTYISTAAIAIRNNQQVRDISVPELQELSLQNGVPEPER